MPGRRPSSPPGQSGKNSSDPENRRFGTHRKALLAGVATLVLAPLTVWAVETYAPKGIGKLQSRPPVTAVAEEYTEPFRVVIPSGTVIPKRLPSDCVKFLTWLYGQGGNWEKGKTIMRLTVESRSADPLTITGIKPKILRRRPPLSGLLVSPPCAPGGGELETQLDFDLDRAGRITGKDFAPHTVSRADPEVFMISASARRGSYEWIPQLTIVRNGKVTKLDARSIHPRAPHFTTRALIQTDKHVYSFDGRWSRYEGKDGRPVLLPGPPSNP